MDKRKKAFENQGYVITAFPIFGDNLWSIENVWNAAWDAATALEREECAKVCDKYEEGSRQNMADICADKIRERSNAEVSGLAPRKGK